MILCLCCDLSHVTTSYSLVTVVLRMHDIVLHYGHALCSVHKPTPSIQSSMMWATDMANSLAEFHIVRWLVRGLTRGGIVSSSRGKTNWGWGTQGPPNPRGVN